MNNTELVYEKLLPYLIQLRDWARGGASRSMEFNIDKIYEELEQDVGSTFNSVPLVKEVYNFADLLYYQVEHKEKQVTQNYTVDEALKDLELFIAMLKSKDFSSLEKLDLKNKWNNNNLSE